MAAIRRIASLVALVYRSDHARTVLSLSPAIPVSLGLTYLSARHLLRGLASGNDEAILMSAALFTVAFAGNVWLSRVVRTSRIHLGELAIVEFNARWVTASLQSSTVDPLERPEHLDRLQVLQGRIFEIGQIPRMLGWLVDAGGGLLVSFVLLVDVYPLLGLVIFGGLPASALTSRAERRAERLQMAAAPDGRRSAHLYSVGTEPSYAMEVRVAGLQHELLERFASQWRVVDRVLFRGELVAGLVQLAGWLIQASVFAAGVALTIARVRSGAIDAADSFIALAAMGLVVGQFGQAAGGLSSIGRVGRLFQDLSQIEQESVSSARAGSSPVPDRLRDGIRLDGVSFNYGGVAHDVLRDVNLHLPAGSVVAVVGENGAGKSTLVKLLFGLHTPTTGSIEVDGASLASIDVEEWRNRTSACFQDHLRLELVALESIGAGDLPRVDNEEAVRSALSRAGATDLVPDLAVQLGARFGGADFSGGEWQRVAIARAFMRGAPLLLALDEPTSALDPLAERTIFDAYTSAARQLGRDAGTITVMVAHRFSTVAMADLVVVLERGRVLEVGEPATLLAAGGKYAELYELQARQYR